MASVSVTVKGATISCTPDPVKVQGGQAVITFDLATPGYAFPASGAIVLDKPGKDFPDPAKTVKDTQVTLLDLCSFTDSYKYSVTVTDLATGKPISVDPTIENQNP